MKICEDSPNRLYVEPDRKDLPHVSHFGREHFSAARPPLPQHTHKGAMELVYIARGRITYEVNEQAYNLKGGDVFLTFPHEKHGTGTAPQERGILYWVGIDMENAGYNFLGHSDAQAAHFSRALQQIKNRHFRGSPELQKNFDRFIDSMLSKSPYRRIIARGALTEILDCILRLEKVVSARRISLKISRCINWIDSHIEEPIQLERIASSANLSLSRFKQRFRDETGMPPYEFTLNRKIDRAKELLKKPGKTVTGTAFQLGFPSSQHFATIFKKITSQTPTQFIQSH
ncbi:MAG: AraC family transcriptional regulator [Victivallaceae bacterium]|nr:AraC family transcriptional regulator [Victivallaceae bacterium]